MTTSQQQTSPSGEDELTYSLADFLANHSVMPGSEKARKMTATSGQACIAPSMKSSPLGLWLKTLLESSQWLSKARFLKWQVLPLYSQRLTTFEDNINSERPLPCNESAQTLKVTDTQSNRFLYRLVPSEPPTDETGYSSSQEDLLPTPVVVDNPHPNSKVNENGRRYNNKAESSHSMGLADRAMHGLLPTPNASDCHNQNTSDNHDLEKGYLRGVAVDMWKKGLLLPTPLVVEREHPDRVIALKEAGADRINSRVNGEQRPNGLIDFMQFYDLLPTPTTDIFKNAGISEAAWEKRIADGRQEDVVMAVYKKYKEADLLDAVKDGKAFRLSPLFTEEMMGFPFLWTALPFLSENGEPKPSAPTEMPSSPK